MQTLESYLNEGIYRDREDIAAVERVLRDTGRTIDGEFRDSTSDWPYEINREGTGTPSGYSQSTSAMMINAIDLLRGTTGVDGRRAPYPFDVGEIGAALEKKRTKAFERLVEEIAGTNKKTAQEGPGSASGERTIGTISRTYGSNDPLTLSFLAEALSAPGMQPPEGIWNYAEEKAKVLLSLDPAKDSEKFFSFAQNGGTETSRPLSNAFVPLRIVRARNKLGVREFPKRSEYLRYFDGTLHGQLSYASIPDSRFDPAELIFCLEGILLLSEQSVDTPLFERVLDVLEAAQKTSAHWRPNKPFLRNERGLVLFPVSIEAANSLLGSCARLDKDERFHRYSERYIALFRRFWGWLAARRVTLERPNREPVSGWHSDHVADPDSIQLWDTAQVVEFLLGYRRGLHNHIARTTLRLARFDVRQPGRPKWPWSTRTYDLEERFRGQGAKGSRLRAAEHSGVQSDAAAQSEDDAPPEAVACSTIVERFEPVTSLGSNFKTYAKIEDAFLRDWLKGTPANFSMLLYGPPGTGKTTVAENLANALGFPMITITVSDFLAEGGGSIEARAKMIFDVLQAQADCVILFDEIDELVLDRSSKRHGMQDTVFKFMTPGMLTKLNNLRRAKRSIFVMATNYAYRIDPAIRRTGRIDENYLLLPPDAGARKRMIEEFLDKAIEKSIINEADELAPRQLREEDWNELEQVSFFLGYKDIEAAVFRVLGEDKAFATLKTELLTWGRTTTLRFYKEAFSESGDRAAVEREFLPLVQMAVKEGEVTSKKHSALDIDEVVKEFKELEILFGGCSAGLKQSAAAFVQSHSGSGSAPR